MHHDDESRQNNLFQPNEEKAYFGEIQMHFIQESFMHQQKNDIIYGDLYSQQPQHFVMADKHEQNQTDKNYQTIRLLSYAPQIITQTPKYRESEASFQNNQHFRFRDHQVENSSEINILELQSEKISPNSQPKVYKNQTKNIAKNYGKAILSFIKKNEEIVKAVLNHCQIPLKDFHRMIKKDKSSFNTIQKLRSIWIHDTYGKCMRIISNFFLRKMSLRHIFNSRIMNYQCHLKHRFSLTKALKNPAQFTCIKQF